MTTLLYHHPAFAEHLTGPGAPECPERLTAIMAALAAPDFASLQRRKAPEIGAQELELVHPADYRAAIMAVMPPSGLRALDGDTIISPRSGEAALRAAGAVAAAVTAIARGEARNAFCAVRPPGHHAGTMSPAGFCIFNNIAVGARVAQRLGLQRVAIVDFDVHHGNGTQEIVWNAPDILFISSHQMPLYPGTGAADDRGTHDLVMNLPLRAGTDGAIMRALYAERVFPRLLDYRPDIILVSAGFDAHEADPLANLRWRTADYAWLSENLIRIANATCAGRLVATLEGGYDLPALGESAAAYIAPMLSA